jgi:hypothetical protein
MILQNHQVVEIKQVKCIALTSASEKAGGEMKVSSIMLLKTHVEKMSLCGLSIIFMIINEL